MSYWSQFDSGAGVIPGTTQNLDYGSAANAAGTAGLALGTGTGTQGMVPVQSNLGGGAGDAIAEFKDWIATPIAQPLSPSGLIILVGIVLVAVIGWNFILYHLRIAAEAI